MSKQSQQNFTTTWGYLQTYFVQQSKSRRFFSKTEEPCCQFVIIDIKISVHRGSSFLLSKCGSDLFFFVVVFLSLCFGLFLRQDNLVCSV